MHGSKVNRVHYLSYPYRWVPKVLPDAGAGETFGPLYALE